MKAEIVTTHVENFMGRGLMSAIQQIEAAISKDLLLLGIIQQPLLQVLHLFIISQNSFFTILVLLFQWVQTKAIVNQISVHTQAVLYLSFETSLFADVMPSINLILIGAETNLSTEYRKRQKK